MTQLYKFSIAIFCILLLSIHNHGYSQSVLSEGHWYKVAIEKKGVYQLTFQDFEAMGFDVTSIDPSKIQIFGNKEGVLPEPNEAIVPYGLVENAIHIHGSEDGSFNEGDYVLFYAYTAATWTYDVYEQAHIYAGHPYADLNYYYITVGEENGKRMQTQISEMQDAEKSITLFQDFQVHEQNLLNFIKSGRTWYGESFEEHGELDISFDFPNLMNDKPVKVGIHAANRASASARIYINPLGASQHQFFLPQPIGSHTYAAEGTKRFYYVTTENEVSLNLTYSKPNASSNAWLDYVEVNAIRELKLHNHQTSFNYHGYQNSYNVYEFILTNADVNTLVWDITDNYNAKVIQGGQLENDAFSFRKKLKAANSFVAFDSEGYFQPQFIKEVSNQDLKGQEPFDMLIITVDDFMEEAQRLADFHIENDQLRTIIVRPEEIYNEFSSGKQDPTAIRNFLKYHYNKNSAGDKPQYLLLFGDASYDYKDVLPANTNIVPVYQSIGSLSTTNTYNTDDYYGIMGYSEGDSSLGEINISIGRFPVNNVVDAKVMVDKTIHYASNIQKLMGNWRNKVCFIADDEDSNLHFNDSNELADTFLITHPEFNVDKLFLDSYVQQNTSNGKRYPDVTDAINRNVEEGVLFFNYTGHGGHLGLTDERILQIPDITSWKNWDKLSVWIVASCEFGPFDDPSHISAGEHMVLNPFGGGVALFTTTRLAYASYNFRLNQKFHEIAFSRKEDGSHYRMGEIIKYAKNESGNKERNLNFVLLGDPALKMAYPEYNVETTHINELPISEGSLDTLKARQTINIQGRITDLNHQTDSDFNGLVDIQVYGKASTYSTLANDEDSYKAPFKVIDHLIYKGQARANNGEFEYTFVVPTNISSSFGNGKISYYATEKTNNDRFYDANGGYIDFMIGGLDESIENDLQGPEINVYLDTYDFKSGDPTTNSPFVMIDLFDENGINNIQLGFGKEIKSILDKQTTNYLDDRYKPVDNSYKEGKIEYRLDELEFGEHELTVKAWDMYDNPSEKTIIFLVISPQTINIYDAMNHPNPFANYTEFVFNHNQTEETELLVNIILYDMMGKQVWNYQERVAVLGNSIEPIAISAGDQHISNLKTGLYTYLLEATNSKGQKVTQKQKLIVVK